VGFEGDALRDRHPMILETLDFFGVVGQEADGVDPEVLQNLCADGIVPLVGPVSQHLIGLDGVVAFVLQVIGLQFVEEPNAATFLAEIEEHPRALRGDAAHGGVELFAAVAAKGPENIPRKALRMDAHENVLLPLHVAVDKGQMILVVHGVFVERQGEFPIDGRNSGANKPLYGKSVHRG
jgi:hypothetical protein